MVHSEIIDLADQFTNLQLHAARGGRETLRALGQVVIESQQNTILGLINDIHENIRYLLPALPPYAPPILNINRFLTILENAHKNDESINVVRNEISLLQNDTPNPKNLFKKITEYLIIVLPENPVIYTHTLSETVLNVLLEVNRFFGINRVVVTESRPNNDGWDTAKKLVEQNIDVQLTIDAAMPTAIKDADLMLSGAEIINLDGSVIGKVGAFPAAVLCKQFGKPVYIIADSNKINHIPWKNYLANKITKKELGIEFSHPKLQVIGTYFDITPQDLIDGYVNEHGCISKDDIPALVGERETSVWLVEQVNSEKKLSKKKEFET